MTPPPFVGNDVVDLDDPRTRGKHADARFTARVLSPSELAVLASSPEPREELWALWAAKEAAYKVLSKLLGEPPVFEHAAFEAAWDAEDGPAWRAGAVSYRGRRVPVEVALVGSVVHAVSTSGPPPSAAVTTLEPLPPTPGGPREVPAELLARFTRAEADAIHSVASAVVRLGARAELARLLGVEEGLLEIVCDPGVTGRRPPRARLRGSAAPADVSLSHHGGWVAWALLAGGAAARG